MLNLEDILCTGCGIDAHKAGYDYEDDVRDDGSYANGKFVCDTCYNKLIEVGLDIGTAVKIQERAQRLCKKVI